MLPLSDLQAPCTLCVIDVQEKLMTPMDPLRVKAMAHNIAILCQAFSVMGCPILCSEQYPKGLGPTLAIIRDNLPGDHLYLEKHFFSLVRQPGFHELSLKLPTSRVVLCGAEAHVCVAQTAVDMVQLGWRPIVVSDAVISRHTHAYTTAMTLLLHQGVTVATTEMVLFRMLESSKSPHFKQIAALLK